MFMGSMPSRDANARDARPTLVSGARWPTLPHRILTSSAGYARCKRNHVREIRGSNFLGGRLFPFKIISLKPGKNWIRRKNQGKKLDPRRCGIGSIWIRHFFQQKNWIRAIFISKCYTRAPRRKNFRPGDGDFDIFCGQRNIWTHSIA